jgi:mono/diheme cytochrome c family protein
MKMVIPLSLCILLFWRCNYDNEESLYGKPSSVCDTTNVTYSKSVQPIIQTWCLACHSNQQVAQGAGGGNHLEGYSNLRIFALNGRLLGAVEHLPGYSPMPKYSNKLNSCDLAKIRIWVNKGAPNN